MSRTYIKKTRDSRVRSGHPWVFRSDVERIEGDPQPGDVVEVRSAAGTFLGRAFYNPNSQITLRMLTQHDEPIDAAFFRRRIETAIAYRKQFCDIDSCRLIFAESDFLPALVVDKFGDVLVMQSLSLGLERWKDDIVQILVELLNPRGIYERDDVPVRRLEGMEQLTGVLYGEVPDRVEMTENGIRFMVDVKNGQKTGFFLDQKQNRAAIARMCEDARVLDCFCHNGSFSLHAAKYGARDVLGVDISEEALVVARENAQLNRLDNVSFEAHNCFDHLRQLTDAKEKFDLVILDPPAFTKTRSAVPGALRGYKEINLRGLKLVHDGGFLVSCSCSQHVDSQAFISMINQAARDAKRKVRMIEYRTQALDHPILPASPETQYLKCAMM
ncbi:class I SAM-dependent rRNA methyltransferase, partial [Eubacteriales bacterium OttesenSCG-928-N13]|nr:class I SAM-dependent rRNA methyltransferase [Eubacteriales bacterium OttesenSCG-928-N13]